MSLNNYEIFVKKAKNNFTMVLNVLFFVIAVGIFVFLYKAAGNVAFVPMPFLLLGAILASKYNNMMSNVEYEYSIGTGVLNIDKIMSQKIRKPVVNLQVNEIVDFGKVSDAQAHELAKKTVKVIYCSSSDENENAYYFTYNLDKKGLHMFVFEPDDRMLRTMSSLSPTVAKALLKNNAIKL